jgi:hypothetical protein
VTAGTDAGTAAASTEAAIGIEKCYLSGVGVAESTITAVRAIAAPCYNRSVPGTSHLSYPDGFLFYVKLTISF